MTLAPDLDAAFRSAFAKALLPPRRERRWASPLDMAQELDPSIVRTPALEVINRALVDVADGACDRLMVFMSPQEAKSTTVSHRFAEWALVNDADTRVAIVSYADEIARRWGSDIKQDVTVFNGDDDQIDLGIRLRADSKAAGRWQVDGRRGGVYCVGVAGSLTGRPVDLLVLDDVHKDLEQARSPAYQERAVRFWQAVAVPRLGPGAKCVLVMTRWHENDLAGHLLQHEGDERDGGRWRVLSIPAECEDEATDPLGRKLGEYMISARGNRDWDAIKRSVGPYVWASLYQQRPAPAEGGLFKRIWWRYWHPAPQVGSGERLDLAGRTYDLASSWRFATIDLANSTRTSADYTVIAAWARTISGDLVLLDLVRAKIGGERHFEHARPLIERWGLDTVFVEGSQYGTTLVREAANSGIPITAIQAETDKFSRALPYSAWVAQGRVWLPSSAHWLDVFRDEHAAFPAAAHDDTVDVGSMACRVAITRAAPTPLPPLPPPVQREVDFEAVAF